MARQNTARWEIQTYIQEKKGGIRSNVSQPPKSKDANSSLRKKMPEQKLCHGHGHVAIHRSVEIG